MTNESEEVTLLTRRRLMDKKGYSDFLYPGELTKKTWKIWQLMKNSKLFPCHAKVKKLNRKPVQISIAFKLRYFGISALLLS